ncbi:putative L-aspartate dehydrogenase [Mizuhopecten yessoensis]|uniref:Aspartate dehydrogenase domain-containing protein n=1 Tax=Mizuhopecten yessoensis TaxID=6573 RepID=A0A210Q6E4_MIZYE|nr:putative L-aspartate dehydrogenase [Mizuhopecten yessoensis]OWF44312.1 L-aspartate dehydrogenase [Mizuhopecten yessoensis]
MRVGVVGYGNLGQYLVQQIEEHASLELAFVWNRTVSALDGLQNKEAVLENLADFPSRKADLIVEVAHPLITKQWGAKFLAMADYMIGSPTALSDAALDTDLRSSAGSHGLYIPTGAFWGGEDIKKMADRGTLQALSVTMTKHPSCFKLNGDLKTKNEKVADKPVVLYEGSVRGLCPLAPNNVNTMAAAAAAAHNLGFDKVTGRLVADPSLTDWHIVEVELWGPGNMDNDTAFHIKTVRRNPANRGVVTGSATYGSFLSSMLGARGKGPGVHLC